MGLVDRIATAVTGHSGAVIIALLLLTAALGSGMMQMEESASNSGLSDDSDVATAFDDAQNKFSNRGPNTTVSLVAVENQEGNTLSRDSLIRTLEYQQALEENATLNATLVDQQPTISVANVIARAAIVSEGQRELPAPRISDWQESEGTDGESQSREADGPTLDEQIEQLESMDDEEVTALVERLLDPDNPSQAGRTAYALLPQSYEPGSATATSHLLVVTQETDGIVRVEVALSKTVTDGQEAAREIAQAQSGPENYAIFSGGLLGTQQEQAITDSLGILGPLALLFVLGALSIAYRDPIDVVLGLAGVVIVLVWTFGAMGWLGINFNQTMIAVPILLIGLSVDYALHVVMRYREEYERHDDGSRAAMARSLMGVGPALVLVTMTTAIGFLANLTSSMGDIRLFGVASALGIVATLGVFGVFIPALKTSISSGLSRFGWDYERSAIGSTGAVRRVLGAGAVAADRIPVVVLFLALLLTAGGVYGAAQVDVATPETAFMADDPPEWTEHLPEQLSPGEYYLKDNRELIYSEFQAPNRQGYVLVEGDVTSAETLQSVDAADRAARDSDVVLEDATGEKSIETPLTAMREAAKQDETFNASFHAADTDGDSVPDRDIEALYDEFYQTTPDLATQTVYRGEDGEYSALRLRIAVSATVDRSLAVAPLEDGAAQFDGAQGTRAIATGQPVISRNLNDDLAITMVEGLALTLTVILALLTIIFRVRSGSASLGAVTLVPVMFSVSWLLGTMALLDIPIGLITALVGSISIGLGVDYAIHVSERFAEEVGSGVDTATALDRTLTGTGSALMSSAVTTAAGFGVLSFALLPALRQFGFILAVGIVYSFLASVYVQPNLLALWARYTGRTSTSASVSAAAGDD